jgi:hypothetical protein
MFHLVRSALHSFKCFHLIVFIQLLYIVFFIASVYKVLIIVFRILQHLLLDSEVLITNYLYYGSNNIAVNSVIVGGNDCVPTSLTEPGPLVAELSPGC